MRAPADLVRLRHWVPSRFGIAIIFVWNTLTLLLQGVAGLSKRDIQLFVEACYNTVESVAYT